MSNDPASGRRHAGARLAEEHLDWIAPLIGAISDTARKGTVRAAQLAGAEPELHRSTRQFRVE